MKDKSRPTLTSILIRCLCLRCPACGQLPIFQAPFQVRHHCPSCGVLFEREEGFFVGAIVINVVTTELAILVVYFTFLLATNDNGRFVIATLLAVALIFPVGFYHHSWSVWLSFDHLVERLPKYDRRDQ